MNLLYFLSLPKRYIDNLKDGTIAKLAGHVSDLYNTAYEVAKNNSSVATLLGQVCLARCSILWRTCKLRVMSFANTFITNVSDCNQHCYIHLHFCFSSNTVNKKASFKKGGADPRDPANRAPTKIAGAKREERARRDRQQSREAREASRARNIVRGLRVASASDRREETRGRPDKMPEGEGCEA